MTPVIERRFAARSDEPFVVFLIGMRINHPLKLRKWVPTAYAMGPLLRELYRNPEHGFLGAEPFLYWPGIAVVQYWRSFEDLERYARSPNEAHLPAWRKFNQRVGSDGSVGIWHESYLVEPGKFETVYNNMPLFGLSKATGAAPATGRRETARRRLGGESEPAVPSPEP
ncbi:MAG: DUF4188 domain-containing protein [Rubrobacteraceae bacterium]